MDDLISRQAAIAEFSCCQLTPDGGIDANYAIDFLKQMPSAQPERKNGEWIEENRRPRSIMFYCSECHRTAYSPLGAKGTPKRCRYAFCPNCGARMEVQE